MSHEPGATPHTDAAEATEATEAPPRQRRRAPLLVAIAVVYLARLVSAALASVPWVAAVSASGVGDFPEGDAKLFERGGLYLLEAVLAQRALLVQLIVPTAGLLLALSLVGVVPEWLLLRALRPAPRAPDDTLVGAPTAREPQAGSEARRVLPRLGALTVSAWAARALLLLVAAALAATVRSYVVGARDERLPSLVTAAVVLVGSLGWAGLSVLHDLAAIEVTSGSASLRASLRRALATLRQRGLGLAARYGLFALASLTVLLAGMSAVAWLDVSRAEAWRPLATGALHQAVILAHVVLHAAWLSSAMPSPLTAPTTPAAHRPHADAFL